MDTNSTSRIPTSIVSLRARNNNIVLGPSGPGFDFIGDRMSKPPAIQKIIDHAAEQLSEAFYECLLHVRNDTEKISIAINMGDKEQALRLLEDKRRYLTELIDLLRGGL